MIAHSLKIVSISLSKSKIASLLLLILLGTTLIPFNASTSFRLPEYYQLGFFLSILGVLVSIIIWLIGYRKELIRITWPDLGFFVFWLYAVIRWCFTPHVHWSQGTAIWLFATLPVYLGFRMWSGHIRMKDLIVLFSILSIGLSGYALLQLYGLLESFNANFKMTGPFFNPAPLAGYLAILFPVILWPVISSKVNVKWRTNLSWFTVALSLLVVIPVQSRAAWVALIAGTGLLLFFRYRKFLLRLGRRAKNALIIASGFLIVGGGLGIYHLKKDSADGRLLIWKVSTAMVAKNPVFGIGYGRFAAEYNLYQRDYFAAGKGSEQEKFLADNNSFAFNEYLKIVAELGIIGLALFLGWVGSFFIGTKSKNHSPQGRVPLFGALLAIACFAFFSYPGSVWGLYFLILLFLSYSVSTCPEFFKTKQSWLKFNGLIVVLYLTIISGIYFRKTSHGSKHWIQANNYFHQQNFEGAREEYLNGVEVLGFDGQFLQHAGKSIALSGNPTESIKLLKLASNYRNDQVLHWTLGNNYVALQNFVQAEMWYISAINMIPNRLYPEYLLANMYYQSSQRQKASELAKSLLKRDIKISSQATKEMLSKLKVLSMIK